MGHLEVGWAGFRGGSQGRELWDVRVPGLYPVEARGTPV